MVQILDQDDFAQEISHDALIGLVIADQVRRHAHEAGTVFQTPLLQLPAPDGTQGQEGGPTAVAPLEEADGGLAVVLGGDHNILHSRAQGRLDGHGVGIVGLNQRGHRPENAAQGLLLGLLHDQAHGLGKALVIPLHLLEHPAPGLHGL